MTETVTILEVTNDFVRHSGNGISHISNFPGAKVGQTWKIETKGFKIVTTKLLTEPRERVK